MNGGQLGVGRENVSKFDTLFSSENIEWRTPPKLFERLNDEFNFTLDPSSADNNYLCEYHFTAKENGLDQDWGGGDSIL